MNLTIDVSAYEQRSQEWKEARIGKLTASQAKRIMGSDAVKKTLALELAAEMMTGRVYESSGGAASRRGIAMEAEALEAFAFGIVDKISSLPGLQVHAGLPRAACSPDGFIGELAMVQIKCPADQKHHIRNAINPDPDYVMQCQYELWVCARERNHLVSYHPDFPPASQVIIHRVDADMELWPKFHTAVDEICVLADTYIAALT